jgi:hypothetical protein
VDKPSDVPSVRKTSLQDAFEETAVGVVRPAETAVWVVWAFLMVIDLGFGWPGPPMKFAARLGA